MHLEHLVLSLHGFFPSVLNKTDVLDFYYVSWIKIDSRLKDEIGKEFAIQDFELLI